MPQINSIQLHLQTGTGSGSDTDGDVYLGICGREFSIDSSADDFESGQARTYVLGEGATIRNADVNDPRKQRLFTENVSNFPVYIRFQPKSRHDHWQLQRADVRFNNSLHIDWDTVPFVANDPKQGIWLGVRCGVFVHLVNLSHGPTGGPSIG
jgi:hypothetical protein